jgi:GNAT superfamily N-acetyltransferase
VADALTLRQARVGDAADIARLAAELGYATPVDAMSTRLGVLLAHPDHHVSVAEQDGALLGWIAAERRRTLESGERIEIVGLVVDLGHRTRGIGRRLVADAEQWALRCGFTAMSVRSNVTRDTSHPFYEGLGYVRRKTQHCYTKPLS